MDGDARDEVSGEADFIIEESGKTSQDNHEESGFVPLLNHGGNEVGQYMNPKERLEQLINQQVSGLTQLVDHQERGSVPLINPKASGSSPHINHDEVVLRPRINNLENGLAPLLNLKVRGLAPQICHETSGSGTHINHEETVMETHINNVEGDRILLSGHEECGAGFDFLYGDDGSELNDLKDIAFDLPNHDQAMQVTNLEVNANGLQYFSMNGESAFFDTLNIEQFLNDIMNRRSVEAENSTDTLNQSPEEASSSSHVSSLERSNRPRMTVSTSCEPHQAQPLPVSLAVRILPRRRNPTKRYDPLVEGRGTLQKPRRQKASTSGEGELEPSKSDELELKQFLLTSMADELWQWATPAIFGRKKRTKFYKRCCTGTPLAPKVSFKLGDAVELMGPNSVKYFGIVAELFQRHRREQDQERFESIDQRVHTLWLYAKDELPEMSIEEVCRKLRKKGLHPEAALFISQHSDVNLLQKVKRPIKLVSVDEYLSKTNGHDSNEHYLAGVYDSFCGKVYPKLCGKFSLPEFLLYSNLKLQALTGKRLVMPRTLTKDWLDY